MYGLVFLKAINQGINPKSIFEIQNSYTDIRRELLYQIYFLTGRQKFDWDMIYTYIYINYTHKKGRNIENKTKFNHW